MTSRCIACKREISKKQSQCYICGASQNYLNYYSKTSLLSLVMLSIGAGISFWFTQIPSDLAEIEELKKTAIKYHETAKQVENLQTQITKNNLQLEESKKAFVTLQENTSNSNNTVTAIEQSLKKTESRAVKAEQRASWLSKENRRYKTDAASLSEKITQLEKDNANLTKENSDLLKSKSLLDTESSLDEAALELPLDTEPTPSETPPQDK